MDSIERRLVLLFPGFEPLPLAVHSERFRRGAEMAAGVWSADLVRADADVAISDVVGLSQSSQTFTMTGAGWRTQTEVVVCDWSDTIARYANRPALARLQAGLAALADFAVTGTAFRYFRTSWRYGLFYLYPIVLIASALAIGALLVSAPLLYGAAAVHLVWSTVLAAGTLAAIARHAVRRLHFLTLMDDWAFARALARRSDPAIDAKIATQADAIRHRLSDCKADEIIVAGHSLGVSLAILALSDALGDTEARKPLGVFSVGSSLLKTALHPAAADQRAAVRTIVENRGLLWVDVQSLSDPLNFYRSNPAGSLGIEGGRTPVVKRISLGKIVGARTRRRIKRDPFRRHRQFVYGTEIRHPYSFHMILLGPIAFERFAAAGSVDLPPLTDRSESGQAPLPEVVR